MALTMVMGLCLLVYALAEYKLRRELKEKKETIPNQVNKEVGNPTMRWIFQLFEGIDVLIYRVGEKVYRMVLNIKEIHRRILSFLGPIYQSFYLWDTIDELGWIRAKRKGFNINGYTTPQSREESPLLQMHFPL